MHSEWQTKAIDDDACVIYMEQVLDNSNADMFSAFIMDLYDNGHKNIFIDMNRLEFLSSAGIGSILGTLELFRERQGDITLVNISSKIEHILEVLNLIEYLTIAESIEEPVEK